MLSAAKINAAKPRDKAYKLADALGLFLLVSPSGGKLWRQKYRFGGKEKLLSFGPYPDVSLVEARERRDAARKLLLQGIDPGEVRKVERLSMDKAVSFESVAREWHTTFLHTWSQSYASALNDRLRLDVLPWLGSRPIAAITSPEVLSVLRRIQDRGALETIRRVKTICSQIFRYAISTGRADRDPTVDLRGATPPARKRHYAAITDPKALAGLLRSIDGYSGSAIVRIALKLTPLVLLRPGEVRHGEWAEIDFKHAQWSISKEKMKMSNDHVVPLSHQAIALLKELRAMTGAGRYIFPSAKTSLRPMSENAVRGALRNMGYGNEDITPHGFRATARTILDEVLHVRPDYIEHQLAHAVKDPNGRAYNRTAHMDERRKMMQLWADYLDGLRKGASVASIRQRSRRAS